MKHIYFTHLIFITFIHTSIQILVNEKCIALILARGGSKQLPRKNLALINGISLLRRTVAVALDSEIFNEIWVSTDDLEICNEATYSGAKCYGRSSETASDTATSLEAVDEYVSFYGNTSCVCLLQCTSPFQSPLYLRDGYIKFQQLNYDSVFSVTADYKLRWKLNDDGSVSPLNFNPFFRPRRQDMRYEYIENGMFYFFRTELLAKGVIQGGKTGIVEIPSSRSIEIDSVDDLMETIKLSSSIFPLIEKEKFMCTLNEYLLQ